jgi:predicted nucleic acid-binding protein
MADLFSELPDFLRREKIQGCFVDTTILFSATYPFDSFNEHSEIAFDALSDAGVPVFTNVNVRAEFLEGHRRVLIGELLIDFLEDMATDLEGPLREKLKSHRTIYRKKIEEEKSAKMDVNQIKNFRHLLASYQSPKGNGWDVFCRGHLLGKLAPIWKATQDVYALHFISLRSDDESPYLNSIPEWERAVELMGSYGIASNDAMILNMFLCSNLPVLLTADIEMAGCALKESNGKKRVFIPDSAV